MTSRLPIFDARDIAPPATSWPSQTRGPLVPIQVLGLVLDCPRCAEPTCALLAFLPRTRTWDRRTVVLCNTPLALAVADLAASEISHVVHSVGRPGYVDGDKLSNRCFHCRAPITGDQLADEVRRDDLRQLTDLAVHYAPESWVDAAIDSAGTFHNAGLVPRPAGVPDFPTTALSTLTAAAHQVSQG